MSTRPVATLELVCCAMVAGGLAVLLESDGTPRRVALPTAPILGDGPLDRVAGALARRTLEAEPAWMAQVGASAGDGLAIAYVAAVPAGGAVPAGFAWLPLETAVGSVSNPTKGIIRAAVMFLREKLDSEPVAFRLLPPTFTLTDLQEVYELLLERRLHKASFRRTLLAAHLVEPIDEWRSEGRGRPAQLFRYSPRRRRSAPKPVRFELLS